jgi:hypothetical protein
MNKASYLSELEILALEEAADEIERIRSLLEASTKERDHWHQRAVSGG